MTEDGPANGKNEEHNGDAFMDELGDALDSLLSDDDDKPSSSDPAPVKATPSTDGTTPKPQPKGAPAKASGTTARITIKPQPKGAPAKASGTTAQTSAAAEKSSLKKETAVPKKAVPAAKRTAQTVRKTETEPGITSAPPDKTLRPKPALQPKVSGAGRSTRRSGRTSRLSWIAAAVVVLLAAVSYYVFFKPAPLPERKTPSSNQAERKSSPSKKPPAKRMETPAAERSQPAEEKLSSVAPVAEGSRPAEEELKSEARMSVEPGETTPTEKPEDGERQTTAQAPPPVVEEEGKQEPPPKQAAAEDEIEQFLIRWKTAWEKSAGEAGDIQSFLSCYSDDFVSNGLDKADWGKHKVSLNRQREWIAVQLKDVSVSGPFEKGRYVASFEQEYQSPEHSDVSKKELVIGKGETGWQILANEIPEISYPYSLHTGSYRSRQTAEQAVEAYQKKGLHAFLTRVDLKDKGIWYRVMVGCFPTQTDAENLIAEEQLSNVKPSKVLYANLIGIYGSAEQMEKKTRLLSELGFFPYVIDKGMGQKFVYVGAFFNRSNADSLHRELASKEIRSRVVKR